ncbi:MAG: DUF4286 family protein [Saprospirales bacterium]|nr:DUF4286 family protein [Saprospirales bacterium]MBK8489452.1 DUF4286 family protein [Saprospirales bacterium]
MVLYNVTVKINNEVKEEWLQWMKGVHIPEVLATGLFLHYRISRILSMEDTDGTTYAFQYLCPDMATLHQYQVHYAPALQKSHADRYKDQYVAFRTVMEVIEEGMGSN